MKLFKATAAVAAMLVLAAAPLQAQQKRASPHETVSAVIDGSRVTVTYGRPFSKDPKSGSVRKIWGGLVPFGKAWRMGSDEATSLITQQPLMFGETALPAGAYTLYLVPNEDGTAKLAFSSGLGGWGVPVNEKADVIRVNAVKSDSAADAEQFTMTVEKGPAGGGVIKLSWEKTTYTVPFTVKK